ncbi:hypothetical protein BDR07DRAFT_1393791, partial [Suillus spraguei]
LLSLCNILDSCGFSESTWFRILKLWRKTSNIMNHRPTLCGRLHALDHEDINCKILTIFWTNSHTSLQQSIHICTFHNNLS